MVTVSGCRDHASELTSVRAPLRHRQSVTALLLLAVVSPVGACRASDTFTVSGTYLTPAKGATSDADCQGPASAEGREVHVIVVGPHSQHRIGQGTLGPGRLDTTTHTYGAIPVCVYPFSVAHVPSGRAFYGAAVGTQPGAGFTEAESKDVTVWGGLKPLRVSH